MNKLKTWREIIILAALAAGLLLYIIFRSAGNINYDLPVLTALDSEKIDRMTISGPEVELDFNLQDNNWIISPEGWIADKTSLKAMVKAVAELKTTDLISSSGSLEKYNLDEEHRITFTAWSGNGILRKFFVGKVSASGIYTYIMLPENKNIYSVRGDLMSRVSKDKTALREKQILTVPRDGILTMSMITEDSSITISKDDSGIWKTAGSENDVDAAVKSVIPMLAPLRCTEFIENLPSSGPRWTIDFQTTEGNVMLELWPKAGENYPARSSQNGYPVLLTSYTTEKILGIFGEVFE